MQHDEHESGEGDLQGCTQERRQACEQELERTAAVALEALKGLGLSRLLVNTGALLRAGRLAPGEAAVEQVSQAFVETILVLDVQRQAGRATRRDAHELSSHELPSHDLDDRELWRYHQANQVLSILCHHTTCVRGNRQLLPDNAHRAAMGVLSTSRPLLDGTPTGLWIDLVQQGATWSAADAAVEAATGQRPAGAS